MSHLGAVVVCQSMGRSVCVSVLTLRNGMLVDIISKHSCTRAGAGAGAVPHPVRAPPHRLFAGCG